MFLSLIKVAVAVEFFDVICSILMECKSFHEQNNFPCASLLTKYAEFLSKKSVLWTIQHPTLYPPNEKEFCVESHQSTHWKITLGTLCGSFLFRHVQVEVPIRTMLTLREHSSKKVSAGFVTTRLLLKLDGFPNNVAVDASKTRNCNQNEMFRWKEAN